MQCTDEKKIAFHRDGSFCTSLYRFHSSGNIGVVINVFDLCTNAFHSVFSGLVVFPAKLLVSQAYGINRCRLIVRHNLCSRVGVGMVSRVGAFV